MIRLALAFAALPAAALAECPLRAERVFDLAWKGLKLQSGGITKANDAIVEIYTDDDGHWVMLRTTPDGRACVVLHGFGWVEEKQGEPA